MTDCEETSEASLPVVARITGYLTGGGLFNPELADHQAVSDLLIDARASIDTLNAEAQERILQALIDNGKWVEETARLRAERDAAVKDAVPLASIRAIAVEAIRTVMGCPDVRNKDGLYLVDEIESTARAAARLFAAKTQGE